jgi:4'-phosphopantetheinyl transferase
MEWARRQDIRDAAWVVYASPEAVLASHDRQSLLLTLSPDELERQGRFRFDQDRDAYLVAHALTRQVLARLCDCDVRALEFEAGERGRPELAGALRASGVRFNLSHTHGLVACAVTQEHDIGVDVEYIERRVELLGVARHVFSEQEVLGLTALTDAAQRDRFFDLWTLKEAYVKAIGKGLGAPLQAITFLPSEPDSVPVLFAAEARDRSTDWCFRRHTPGPAHRLAVALRAGPSAAVRFTRLDSAALLTA